MDYKINNSHTHKEGNWVALDISINDVCLTLISIYGPNEDKSNFYYDIKKVKDDINNVNCIVCGDWNLIQDTKLDSYNYIRINNQKARKVVLEMKTELEMIDPWRFENPVSRRYTWRQPTPLKQSRLDFFLMSSELTTLFKNVKN